MTQPPEPWVPKSPEDWEGVFAGGLRKYEAERAEIEAKNKEENPPKEEVPAAKSWAERLLG